MNRTLFYRIRDFKEANHKAVENTFNDDLLNELSHLYEIHDDGFQSGDIPQE